MKDVIVGFKVAKVAKEKGFDIPTNTLFQHNKMLHEVLPSDTYPHLAYNREEIDDYTTGYYNWNSLDLDEEEKLHKISGFSESDEDWFTVCFSAPTQSLLQMWLREEERIMVWCEPVSKSNTDEVLWTVKLIDWSKKNDIIDLKLDLLYEEALEKGLIEALKLIKNK